MKMKKKLYLGRSQDHFCIGDKPETFDPDKEGGFRPSGHVTCLSAVLVERFLGKMEHGEVRELRIDIKGLDDDLQSFPLYIGRTTLYTYRLAENPDSFTSEDSLEGRLATFCAAGFHETLTELPEGSVWGFEVSLGERIDWRRMQADAIEDRG